MHEHHMRFLANERRRDLQAEAERLRLARTRSRTSLRPQGRTRAGRSRLSLLFTRVASAS